MKRWTRQWLGLCSVVWLAACGGGGGSPPALAVPFNVTESALYDPVRNAQGTVVQNGSGMVSLQLESFSEGRLPLSGDTKGVGFDAVYFDLIKDGRVSLNLSQQDLQHVSSVVLVNAQDQTLLTVDNSEPQGSVLLSRGDASTPVPRFQLRITTTNGTVNNPQVLVWFGNSPVPTADVQQLKNFSGLCTGCQLSGAYLGQYSLDGVNLSNADLRNTLLVKVINPADLQLSDGQVFKLFLNASQVSGARMNGSNLTGADLTGAVLTGAGDARADLKGSMFNFAILNAINLDGADLSGVQMNHAQASQASWIRANLSGAQLKGANLSMGNFEQADFSGADLSGSNLSGSNFSGATWTDGRVCENGSVGECR
ncbi:pentapeptide repeat-containing protein [Limnohabitans sp.]